MRRVAVIAAALTALLASAVPVHAAVSIAVDSATQYQTIRGWGAITPWQVDVPDRLAQQIIKVGVEDLRLNCFRYEPPAGWFNSSSKGAGHRWEWNNDDDDPLHVNWAAMNTADLDERVVKWLLPIKQAVEAGGRPFDVQISPSFFDGGSSGSAPVWLLQSPGEYAEYATALLLRLRDTHGIEADYYTICNEAGNNNSFSAGVVGRMIKALGPRMEQLGLSTRIEFPESINAYAAWASYITATQNDARVWKYVDVISYHLYGGLDYRDDLRDFAIARGLQTAQTEFMESSGNAIDYLYGDLTDGGVSEWEVYGQGFPTADNTRSSLTRSSSFWSFRQIMPYVEPGSVRIDAISNNGTLRPLAFLDGGEVTMVLLNTSTTSANQSVTVSGLPAGEYAVSQSVNKGAPQELGLRTVAADGLLTLDVVKGAMLTIYPHAGNLPPEVTDWKAADAYLKLGVSNSTVLSAAAVDPELDALTYAWRVEAQPEGAMAALISNEVQTLAVNLTVAGQYVFAVEVGDGVNTVTREVILNVYDGNQLPQIELHMRSPAQLILPASSATLRVYAWDPDNTTLIYHWTVVSSPPGAAPVFTSPTGTSTVVSGLTVAGDYVFRAVVNDGIGVAYHDIPVTVEPADLNAPFITGAAGSVFPNGCGLLSAVTGDVDGDATSHWWEWVSGPADANVRFSHQGRATTPVWTDIAGTYVFRLIVVGRAKYAASSLITLNLPAASAPTPGDLDLDGDVDLNDFFVLKVRFGRGTAWDDGDFDSDGDVDLDDFVLMKKNFGTTTP